MKKRQPKKLNVVKSELGHERSGTYFLSSHKIFSESRALFLIVAATVLIYANSLNGAFVFDDTKQIVGNPSLHTWSNIFRAFTSDVWNFQRGTLTADIPPPYYRPLFTAYLTLNYQLFGLWEPGWHLMNLLVHAVSTVSVYFLLKRLSDDRFIATLAALVFGLHPAHVESVSWISGIPDPLSALFYVPSLLWYVRYREEGERKWLVASLVLYALSTLCKETPLTLPLVLCVWELARGKSKQGQALRLKEIVLQIVPYAVVAASYLALRFSVLGRISWKHPFMASVPDSAIWMTMPYVFVSYLKHLIAPFYLSLIYGTSFITKASDPRFFVPVGLLFGLGYLYWIYRNKLDGQVWVALAMIIAPLLPVLNLKVFHNEYIIQDRYLYLPSIGFCYLIAMLIARLARERAPLAAVVSAMVVLVFSASTILQNRVWRDSVALWQRAVYYSPSAWSTHYNLGLAYLVLKQHETARTELLEAKRLDPKQAAIYNNLALAQAGLGDVNSATMNLKTALALDPRLLEAHNNLGTFLYDKGDYAGARREFLNVIQRDPASNSARFNLARTLAATGDHSAAIREYEALLAQEPNDVAARYQLAVSYAATSQKQKAVTELSHALRTDRDANRAAEMRKKLEEIESK